MCYLIWIIVKQLERVIGNWDLNVQLAMRD